MHGRTRKARSLKGSPLSEVDGRGPAGEEMPSATNQAAAGKKNDWLKLKPCDTQLTWFKKLNKIISKKGRGTNTGAAGPRTDLEE